MLQHQTETSSISRIKRQLFLLQNALLARSGMTAYIPITLVTFFMFCGASWLILLPATDPARYQCYALTFWLGGNATFLPSLPVGQCSFLHNVMGQAPFHMLPLEYPPLTLLFFSLPLLMPLPYYQVSFALLMSLVCVLIYWLLQRFGPRGGALIFALYIFLGAIGLAQVRYDLLPALLMLLCVIAAERKQWSAAYVALAFAVLLKIYPILGLPVLFMAEQQSKERFYTPSAVSSYREMPQQIWYTLRDFARWHWKNTMLFLGLVLGVTGIFALFNFNGAVVSQITYFAQRPIQVEATGSTLLWIGHIFGIPWQDISYRFGSINIVSDLTDPISQLGTVFMIVGYLYVLRLQWRKKIDITQATIAVLLVFIATGKVFSPQYLIWLIPLLAYAGAFDWVWLFLWGGVALPTSILYIFVNSQLPTNPTAIQSITLSTNFFELVAVRNTFFVLLTLSYLFNWFRVRQRRPIPHYLPTWRVRTA